MLSISPLVTLEAETEKLNELVASCDNRILIGLARLPGLDTRLLGVHRIEPEVRPLRRLTSESSIYRDVHVFTISYPMQEHWVCPSLHAHCQALLVIGIYMYMYNWDVVQFYLAYILHIVMQQIWVLYHGLSHELQGSAHGPSGLSGRPLSLVSPYQ